MNGMDKESLYDQYFKEPVQVLASMEQQISQSPTNPYLMRDYVNASNGLLFAVLRQVERLSLLFSDPRAEERQSIRPESISDVQREIGAWSRKTFPLSSINSTMKHLWAEMVELDKAVERNSGTEASEEAADVFILLVQLCTLMKIDLGASIALKHEENLGREWLPPNGDGVVFHKKGID